MEGDFTSDSAPRRRPQPFPKTRKLTSSAPPPPKTNEDHSGTRDAAIGWGDHGCPPALHFAVPAIPKQGDYLDWSTEYGDLIVQ